MPDGEPGIPDEEPGIPEGVLGRPDAVPGIPGRPALPLEDGEPEDGEPGREALAPGIPEGVLGRPDEELGIPEGVLGRPDEELGIPEGVLGRPDEELGIPEDGLGRPDEELGIPEEGLDGLDGELVVLWEVVARQPAKAKAAGIRNSHGRMLFRLAAIERLAKAISCDIVFICKLLSGGIFMPLSSTIFILLCNQLQSRTLARTTGLEPVSPT